MYLLHHSGLIFTKYQWGVKHTLEGLLFAFIHSTILIMNRGLVTLTIQGFIVKPKWLAQ
jgi:hypothetical protein